MTDQAFSFKIRTLAMLAMGLVLALATVPAEGAAQTLEPLRDSYRLEPKPVPQEEPPALPELGPGSDVEARPQNATGATVHLASYYTAMDAMRGWNVLKARYPDLLADFDPVLKDVDLGERGQFVRLLAGPIGSLAEAESLCKALRGEGAYCVPSDATGEVLYPPQGFGG
ncbi:SPOR domain-containing protein [Parvularcula lutaonensis]|uniref:SPOR domain-containing protein n=1 Tax=Parvularcula lutaonensis TaxID=491923 RepID=A0ABV7M8K6_9PROT|nr:SPOR domain-containing protein [Parvularcula lutaonensis]GGY44697.1 hypothetical protein GCM10007148_12010 [Parvularcula lutaonensis]